MIKISCFGSAESLKEYEDDIPKIIHNDDVLIRVISAGINPLDIKKRKGELKLFYGHKTPMEVGNDVVGEIADIPPNAVFKKGDLVYCMIDSGKNNPKTGFCSGAGYSEYCITKLYTLARIPKIPQISSLAAVPLAGLTALQALKKCRYTEKKNILINGASGGVGLYAVQIAKGAGLSVHTVSNTRAFDMLKELGSEHQFDYRDSSKKYLQNQYDIIFDVADTMANREIRAIQNKDGIYISNIASLSLFINDLLGKIPFYPFKKKTFIWVKSDGRMLSEISDMIENDVIKVIVQKEFPLSEAKDAHLYCERNSVIGKVLLNVGNSM